VPTPAKTSQANLVDIGLALATEGGADAVTIAAVAQAAGIKGPSLYKHFADREALLTAIEIAVLYELEAVLRQVKGRTPRQRIVGMAHAYRAFGHRAPRRYGLIYRKNVADDPALAEACLFSARPLFEELEAAGVPPKRILVLSRTLVAFLHGFVSMEIAQAFRLGGDLDEAFEASLTTILRDV
jgi:AcrR family transcriptional regulator